MPGFIFIFCDKLLYVSECFSSISTLHKNINIHNPIHWVSGSMLTPTPHISKPRMNEYLEKCDSDHKLENLDNEYHCDRVPFTSQLYFSIKSTDSIQGSEQNSSLMWPWTLCASANIPWKEKKRCTDVVTVNEHYWLLPILKAPALLYNCFRCTIMFLQ